MSGLRQETEKIEAYINRSIVEAKVGRKCVDGRYLPDQATGMIARPGGDGGYVMALMAVSRKKKLGLTPEQCFNAVYKIVEKDSGFCMHTDRQTDPGGPTHRGLIGCGHMAKAAMRQFGEDYDVNSADVEKVVNYARNLHEITHRVHIVNLTGDHKEQGVLIVNSDKYTVLADNPKLNQMYFIYDEQRDTMFIKHLVDELAFDDVTYDDMKAESDLQLHATLQILAANLPIYTVSFDGKTPQVLFAGRVEPKLQPQRAGFFRRMSLRKLPLLPQKLLNR